MRITLLIIGALVFALLAYWGARFALAVQVSKRLIEEAVPYSKEGAGSAVLVLGDSTAVGVGADTPEETVAGRASAHLGAGRAENYARSGAVTAELAGQIERAALPEYRLVLIQIGGNDIIRFKSAARAADELRRALRALPPAERVVVISAGDVGGAPLFPPPLRPFYTWLNTRYHAAFAEAARKEGAVYVDFGKSPSTDEINARPDVYLAADGLHPSSEGYRLWFEETRPHL